MIKSFFIQISFIFLKLSSCLKLIFILLKTALVNISKLFWNGYFHILEESWNLIVFQYCIIIIINSTIIIILLFIFKVYYYYNLFLTLLLLLYF